MKRFSIFLFVFVALTIVACQKDIGNKENNTEIKGVALRGLTPSELNQDFLALTDQMKSLYGPLEFKEKRFGFSFDTLRTEYLEKLKSATSEGEAAGIFYQFLNKFEDGHVSIRFPLNSEGFASFELPLVISPFGEDFLVTEVAEDIKNRGVNVGDQVVSIDGQPVSYYLDILLKYRWFGNPVSDRHLVGLVTLRPFYVSELLPKEPIAKLVLRDASGVDKLIELVWRRNLTAPEKFRKFVLKEEQTSFFSENLASIIEAKTRLNVNGMGADIPFFISDEVKEKFKLIPVKPSLEALKSVGYNNPENMEKDVPVYAALFSFKEKTILLLRQPTYSPDRDEVVDLRQKYVKALLKEYQTISDVLVIDQTHNPGGWISYVRNYFSLFISKDTPGMVQFMNTDRKWIARWYSSAQASEVPQEDKNYYIMAAKEIEEDYDAGLGISRKPYAFQGNNYVRPDKDVTWKKPILVLADELAGSCGDVFPMLMQRNGVAKIFGQRTMGLGGNVEEIVVLPNSQAKVSVTRGLFVTYRPDGLYNETDIVENNGVEPDYPYPIKASDLRDGYVTYFENFATKAVELLTVK